MSSSMRASTAGSFLTALVMLGHSTFSAVATAAWGLVSSVIACSFWESHPTNAVSTNTDAALPASNARISEFLFIVMSSKRKKKMETNNDRKVQAACIEQRLCSLIII
jgi:hypothetical protein